MRIPRPLTCAAIAASVFMLTLPAAADTVYLKNGRTIDSSSVRVEGDRVYVRLYGGQVSFPMAVVDRIEENEAVEPSTRRITASEPDDPAQATGPDAATGADATDPAAEGEPDSAADAGATGDPGAGGEDPGEEPPPTPPEQTREYWQDRLRPLQQEIDRIDGELDDLRSTTGAGIQARIDRLEQRRARVREQVDAIEREARQLGVPPGWLRVR